MKRIKVPLGPVATGFIVIWFWAEQLSSPARPRADACSGRFCEIYLPSAAVNPQLGSVKMILSH